jgi:uncharacterized membrane protein (DUF2068 family)
MQERPVGVAAMAVAAGAIGVIALLEVAVSGLARLPDLQNVASLIVIVVGLSELVFAYGAWMLRPWTWTFGVGLAVIVIVLAVLDLTRAESTRNIVVIAIAGVMLWSLATPRVRAAFGRS